MKTSNEVKVSIIVPIYNVEKYLKKCLDSLINQTFKEIEIILVNDGSTDKCGTIISKYSGKYPSIIKVLEQDNQGLSDARNNGFNTSCGKYIMFIDSDDYVELDMVEKMYNKITNDRADVVICGNNVVDEQYSILSSTYPTNVNFYNEIEKTIFGNMCAWNKIYKRSMISKHKLKFRSKIWYEDIDFSYKLMTLSKKTTFLEENLYNYLLRKDSIMNNQKVKRNLELILAFDEMINYGKSNDIYDKFYNEIEFLCINHMYISAITRVINSKTDLKTKKEIIKKFITYIKVNFPNYRTNKYLKYLPKNRKIIYNLISLKQFWLIALIFKIKYGVE